MDFRNTPAYNDIAETILQSTGELVAPKLKDELIEGLHPLINELVAARLKNVVFDALKNEMQVLDRVSALDWLYTKIFTEYTDPDSFEAERVKMARYYVGEMRTEYERLVVAELGRQYIPGRTGTVFNYYIAKGLEVQPVPYGKGDPNTEGSSNG